MISIRTNELIVTNEQELRDAILYNEANPGAKVITIPVGHTIVLTETLPPVTVPSFTLRGERGHSSNSWLPSPTIDHSAILDGPALIVQQHRTCVLEGIHFEGPNQYAYFGYSGGANEDDRYLLPDVRDHRYSPQCAVAFDAITDGAPSGDPNGRWPGLEHLYDTMPGRGQGGSGLAVRGCTFRAQNCAIFNGNQGVALGDNAAFYDCAWHACRTPYAGNGTQQRCVNFYNCSFGTWSRCAINTLEYGEQKAPPPALHGGCMGVGMQAPYLLAHSVGNFVANGVHHEGFSRLGVLGTAPSGTVKTATFMGCQFTTQMPLTPQEWREHEYADAWLVNTMMVRFAGCSITAGDATSVAPKLLRFYNLEHIAFEDTELTAFGGALDKYPISFLRPNMVSTSNLRMLNDGQIEYHTRRSAETKSTKRAGHILIPSIGDPETIACLIELIREHQLPAVETTWHWLGGHVVTVNPGPGGTATIDNAALASQLSEGDIVGSYNHLDILAWYPKVTGDFGVAGTKAIEFAIGMVESVVGNVITLTGVGQNLNSVLPLQVTPVRIETRMN